MYYHASLFQGKIIVKRYALIALEFVALMNQNNDLEAINVRIFAWHISVGKKDATLHPVTRKIYT